MDVFDSKDRNLKLCLIFVFLWNTLLCAAEGAELGKFVTSGAVHKLISLDVCKPDDRSCFA